MSCEIYEIWDELCSAVCAIAPAYQTVLAKPATEGAIRAVQENLGLTLPRSYAEFLHMHNGTPSHVLIAFELLGVVDLRAATQLRRTESLASRERPFLEGGWDEHKVIIGDSQIGWELVLDCESDAVFVYEQNNYALQLADSFTAYLSGLHNNLRNGQFQLVDGKVFMEGWGERW